MKNVYVVLPYTKNYKRPIGEKAKVFTERVVALGYLDRFEFVELITTPLN